jgi:hypothetical protein
MIFPDDLFTGPKFLHMPHFGHESFLLRLASSAPDLDFAGYFSSLWHSHSLLLLKGFTIFSCLLQKKP